MPVDRGHPGRSTVCICKLCVLPQVLGSWEVTVKDVLLYLCRVCVSVHARTRLPGNEGVVITVVIGIIMCTCE